MTLRDHFAGLAFAALLGGEDPLELQRQPHNYAVAAYRLADAMLYERDRHKKSQG